MMLDKVDRRILRELDRNSRQSVASIAKVLSLAPETVRYRVGSLLERKIIQNFLTVVDGGKLGFYYFKIFFKLYNVHEEEVQEIIAVLSAIPEVNWVVRVDGPFDIGLTVRVLNPVQLSVLIDGLRSQYSAVIHRWTLSINIQMDFLIRDFLTGHKRKPRPLGRYNAQTEPYKLDSLGWKIIDLLALDSRTSATAIGEAVGLTPDTVLNRIKRLERDEVIVRHGLVLNNQLIGQYNYYVLIYLNRLTAERREAFVQTLMLQPNITYVIKALGEWDYEISVEVERVEEYRTLMMKLTKDYSDIIRDYNGMLVNYIHKYIYP